MDFRFLSIQNIDELYQLLRERGPIWNAVQSRDISLESLSAKLKDQNRIYVGCFDENQLIGCISARLWTGLPYYTIGDLTISQNHDRFQNLKSISKSKMIMAGMISMLVSEMEKQGRSTFYVLTALRYVPRAKFRKDDEMSVFGKFVPALAKYHFIAEAIFPANTMPDFEVYRSFLAHRTHPIDLVLRRVYRNAEPLLTDSVR